MLIDRQRLGFLLNKEVDYLYAALGILYFAEGLISVFVPIYFYNLGFALWRILLFYFILSFFFVILSVLFMGAFKKLSDRTLMLLSVPLMAVHYYGLGFIKDLPYLFYILPAFVALSMLFFNVGYHISFTASLDDGYIGRELGVRHIIGSISQFLSPFIGGVLITIFGFVDTFTIGIFISFFVVFPLLFIRPRNLSSRLNPKEVFKFLKNKTLFSFNLSGAGFAMEKMVDIIIWPIFIFIAVGSIEKFGGIISAGLLVSALANYLIGYLSDVGRRRKVLSLATYAHSFIWILRSFVSGVAGVVGTHFLSHLARGAIMVSWGSQYYKIARSVKHLTLFVWSREIIYHLSRVVFLPVLMFLSYFFPEGVFFRVSFILAAAVALLFLSANKFHTRDLKNEI